MQQGCVIAGKSFLFVFDAGIIAVFIKSVILKAERVNSLFNSLTVSTLFGSVYKAHSRPLLLCLS